MMIEDLIRPNIRRLKPYRSARQDHMDGMLLDANENAYGSPFPFFDLPLNRYPDPYHMPLRRKLAEMNGTTPDRVFVGSGSDEIIDLLFRIYCSPGIDSVIVPEPTYGMYRVAADIHNVPVVPSLLTDLFQLDLADIKAKAMGGAKMVFCCSPNNPTANLYNEGDVLDLCSSTEMIVVVDEAYVEFSGTPSMSRYCEQYPNLVVMRTLSKAWGLAGIRLGYCFAHPMLIAYFDKVKTPYNVNAMTAFVSRNILDDPAPMRQTVGRIVVERRRLADALASSPIVRTVYPSDANFLLVRVTDAAAIYSALLRLGIIVRDRSTEPKLENCLRITVGTPEENDQLIRAIGELTP
jgi:histidinol-phosphate aminotransferase